MTPAKVLEIRVVLNLSQMKNGHCALTENTYLLWTSHPNFTLDEKS